MSPNVVAWTALASWPVAALVVYGTVSERRLARTTAWMLLLPVMFLPSNIQLKTQGIPYFDKYRLTFVSIALGLVLFHRRRPLRDAARWVPAAVLVAMVAGVVATVRTNGDVLIFGPRTLPGLTSYDVLSVSAGMLLDIYLPFFIGQRVFRTGADLRDLFDVLSLAGLLYVPFCLFEVRFSPQLHYWVYGYYPSEFVQAMRYGGFRPMVFMNHGLGVAMFLFSSLCATLGLRAAGLRTRYLSAGARGVTLGGVLVLCKSFASILYSAVAVALQPLLRTRALSRLAILLAVLVVAYPVTRAAQVFPTRALVGGIAALSAERADSLDYRFSNEDLLVARAMQRPLFGWGTFGRGRIYASWGDDVSVTDGEWIVLLGAFGFVGFLGAFSFMLFPLVRFARNRRRMPPRVGVLVSTLAILVMLGALDMLPNSAQPQAWTWAGALFTLSSAVTRRRTVAPGGRGGELRRPLDAPRPQPMVQP